MAPNESFQRTARKRATAELKRWLSARSASGRTVGFDAGVRFMGAEDLLLFLNLPFDFTIGRDTSVSSSIDCLRVIAGRMAVTQSIIKCDKIVTQQGQK